MAERHPAAQAPARGLVGDELGERVPGVGRVVGEVRVQIGRHPVLGGEVEHELDVAAAVVQGGLVVGAAAHHVGARRQCRDQQLLGAGRPQDPLLRERHDLEVHHARVLRAESEQDLDAEQPGDRVHVRMGADHRRAVEDRRLQDAPRTSQYVLVRERALQFAGDRDRSGEGAVGVASYAVQKGLVEMQMGFDEAGQDDPARAVDHLVGVLARGVPDGSHPAAVDHHVAERPGVFDACLTQYQLRHASSR